MDTRLATGDMPHGDSQIWANSQQTGQLLP